MFDHISTFLLLALSTLCVGFSNGASLNGSCVALDQPGWTIDSLKNVELNEWPLDCLQTRFTNNSLSEQISKFSPTVFDAAAKGYIGFVQYYIEKKGSTYSANRKSIIMREAAKGGHFNILKYLIDEKAYHVKKNDAKLLANAAFGGNVDLIQYLVNEKNLTKDLTLSSDQRTALHEAALGGKLEMVRFLVETWKFEVDAKNIYHQSPVHFAAQGGNLAVLKYLEQKGADMKAESTYAGNLLHIAARYNNLEIAKYLVEEKHFDVEELDNFVETPLLHAVEGGSLDTVKYLIGEKHANINITAKHKSERNLLHHAVLGGSVEVMKYLVDDVKMLNRIEEKENTGQTVAMFAADKRALPILKFLLDERHANKTTVDWAGQNMLHVAALEFDLNTVKYLVEEEGFDVHAKTPAGETAYDLVRMDDEPDEDLMNYLQKKMNENPKKQGQ